MGRTRTTSEALRRQGSNLQPPGHEPGEITISLLRKKRLKDTPAKLDRLRTVPICGGSSRLSFVEPCELVSTFDQLMASSGYDLFEAYARVPAYSRANGLRPKGP